MGKQTFKWGFSTMGCPTFTFEEVAAIAKKYNIEYFELRTLENSTNVPALFDEKYKTVENVQKVLDDTNTKIIGLNSGFKLFNTDDASRNELLQFAKWANALNAPGIRVFGGAGYDSEITKEKLLAAKENCLWWKEQKAKNNWKCDILLETHSVFASTERIFKLYEVLDQPIDLIWDSHHTFRYAKEDFKYSWDNLKPYIKHVHAKDSIDTPSAKHHYTYVLPGEGQLPVMDLLAMLTEAKYNGVVSLEWELQWHPYLPTLEEAIIKAKEIGWIE